MSEKTGVRTFPVPKPLATPTDFSEEQVRSVTEAVDPLVADAFALHVKTKNYHWHLSGAQADEILASKDPLAERVRLVGRTTVRRISHIGDLQTVEDDSEVLVDWTR